MFFFFPGCGRVAHRVISCDIALNVIGRICCDAGGKRVSSVEGISGSLIMEEWVKPSRVRFHMYMYIAVSVF